MDFVQDAAWLSAKLRKPVKAIWDREEDFKLGYLRPMTGQFIRAALREDGTIAAWHHRVACEDPVKVHEPLLWQAWQQIPLIGMLGSEHRAEDGSDFAHAYDLQERLVEYVPVETGVRVYAMRGVGALPGKFAIESFIDEAAAEARTDLLVYRLALLHRSARARYVLETVAEMAGWGRHRNGRALGLAYSHYAGTLIGCIAEVSVDAASGDVRVHNIWVAVDAGIVIQPDNFLAQVEGGILYGLSNALMERITLENGHVQQSNFSNYPVLRIGAAPRVHVRVVKSLEPPTGIGEIGAVVAPAAMANAFATLTGKRVRQLPFTTERVRTVLA
jgi:isoquinoline 1-oxidoreductase beta subunit